MKQNKKQKEEEEKNKKTKVFHMISRVDTQRVVNKVIDSITLWNALLLGVIKGLC